MALTDLDFYGRDDKLLEKFENFLKKSPETISSKSKYIKYVIISIVVSMFIGIGIIVWHFMKSSNKSEKHKKKSKSKPKKKKEKCPIQPEKIFSAIDTKEKEKIVEEIKNTPDKNFAAYTSELAPNASANMY